VTKEAVRKAAIHSVLDSALGSHLCVAIKLFQYTAASQASKAKTVHSGKKR